MIDLLPCPFCGEVPFVMSVGMAGQPRWQHPVNDTCPIAGHYLGGWDFPEQWNRRALPAVQPRKEVMPDETSSARGSSDTAPAGLSAGGGAEPTDALVASACLSYRHDFGLLGKQQQEAEMFRAREWLRAWQKEFAATKGGDA